jgi:hypothetical protein
MLGTQDFRGRCVRLMFSPLSKVLCVNMFRLNPYAHSHTNQNVPITLSVLQTLKQEMSESKRELVRQSLYASNQEMTDTDDEAQLRWPVYLNRNKRLMKRIRKDLELNE